MKTSSVRIPLLALAAWSLSWPAAAAAELAKWDPERVTALAQELVEKADRVQDALRQQGDSTIGSGQAHAYYRLKQDVRRTRTEAKHLAASLKGGAGYDQTLPVYQDLMGLVASCQENARKMFLQQPTMDAILQAGDALRRIAPYYDPEALARPEDPASR